MKVAIFQANTVNDEIELNLLRYDSLLKKLESDTELLVFPEMFTSGFSLDINYAETMQGRSLKWMKAKAIEKGTAISGSLFINENDRYFNRHFFVIPNGEYEYYDKKHLFSLSKEPKLITSGNDKRIVNYKGWRIAIFTCYDIRFPIWCRNTYSNNKYGYDIAIYVASWALERNFAWQSLLIGRAIENMAYTIGVNRVGTDKKGVKYNGSSVILNYKGETLAMAENEKEEIVYHTLDNQSLLLFRQSFPIGKDWD